MSGATGVLGTPLLAALGDGAYALLRGTDFQSRAAAIANRSRVQVEGVAGDVTAAGWGIRPDVLDHLRGRVHVVVHLAAETDWGAQWERLDRVNVLGTVNAVEVARALGVPLVHISSLFAAYRTSGMVDERLVAETADLTGYERSKCRSEWAVAAAMREGLPATIVRLGAIVGDALPNESPMRVRAPFLRLLRGAAWPVLPICPSARIDLVPRDIAVDQLAGIISDPQSLDSPVHHVALGSAAPTIGALTSEVRAVLAAQGDRNYRPVPAPSRLLRYISLQADRFGTSVRTTALVGLRYLACETEFASSRQLPTLSMSDLMRCIGLAERTSGSVRLHPYYDEW